MLSVVDIIELIELVHACVLDVVTESGVWHLDLKNGSGAAGQGEPSNSADVTFVMTTAMFVDMFAGKLNPTTAFMTGKMKLKGDLGKAMKLEKLMKKMQKSKL